MPFPVRRFLPQRPWTVRPTFLPMLLGLAGCGSESSTQPPAPDPQPVEYTLTVVHLDGVGGTPATGTYQYPAGASVAYSYSTQPGFEDLSVLVDGVEAPASGAVVISADASLGVSAAPIPVVPPGAQAQVQSLTRTLEGVGAGSVAPMEGYRGIQAAAAALEGSVPLDSIPGLLSLAALRAFTPDQSIQVARALQEIADSLSATQAAATTDPARAPSAPPGAVTYLYVNGVNTALGAETVTTDILTRLVRSAGFADGSRYRVASFYNAGSTAADVNDLGAMVCFTRDGAALRGGGSEPSPACQDLLRSRVAGGDLQQAYGQVLARVIGAAPVTSIGRALADRMQASLAVGPVVLVAHSQGNLMAHEALRELERRGAVDGRCVGVVSLAPPLPVGPMDAGGAPSAMFVTGAKVKDILLLAEDAVPNTFPGIRGVPAASNELSAFWNRSYETLTSFWLGVLSGGALTAKATQALLAGSVDLHSVDRSYLRFHADQVSAALVEQTNRVEAECVQVGATPPSVTFSVPSGVQSGDVTVGFNVTDGDGGLNDFVVSYGAPDVGQANPATLARVSAGRVASGSNGATYLRDVPVGPHTLVWRSGVDYAANATSQMTMSLAWVDPATGGQPLAFRSGAFTVDNRSVSEPPDGLGPDQFVLIPAGTFQMGSTNGDSDERPVHTVTLTKPFYLQKTEVTQAQWRSVMGTNPSYFSQCGDDCPVERVSWNDIQDFLQRLNAATPGARYRLPTEAEWEYAARAGTTGDYGGSGVLDEMGWYSGNSGGRTHPVAQKRANAWGLYDMHGNVWEWVQDRYASGYYRSSPSNDPQGPDTGSYRVVRGGSWSIDAYGARSASRGRSMPAARTFIIGFRLARTP